METFARSEVLDYLDQCDAPRVNLSDTWPGSKTIRDLSPRKARSKVHRQWGGSRYLIDDPEGDYPAVTRVTRTY